jgi:hypothetical protein
MISSFSGHAFFEQTQFEGLLGDDLFQLQGLALEVFDLAGGCRSGRVAGQTPLAGFEELFRPAVVLLSAIPSRRQSSAIVTSPRKPSRTMRIFSSAECCLRVARRISLTRRSDGVSGVVDFCLMPTPQGVTMSPNSSVPQAASFVSQVSMSDIATTTRTPCC